MFFKRSLLVLVLLLCYAPSSAKVTLKKSFFTGWKYSADGSKFQKVGFSGTSLYNLMEGNDEAQTHMKNYKSAKTWAAVSGWPGGFLIGWPIGGYIGSGGDWKDGYTTMIIIGIPLAVVSVILEGSATRNLKKAVDLYNGEEQSLGFKLDFDDQGVDRPKTYSLNLTYTF